MRTDELVARLAADAAPVVPGRAERRCVLSLAVGAAAAGLLMALAFGARADLAQAAWLPMFWLKLAFAGALAVAAGVAVHRLGRPGLPLGRVGLGFAAPLAAVALLAVGVLLTAAPAQRAALVLGTSWATCPLGIAALSLPVLAAALVALRQLAPTRLALAGAAAGALAGAIGAFVYALHCTEMAAPFVAVWYVAGMALPVALGALLGPRLLRW